MSLITELSTFTCFNSLPKELRLDIWELALPGPRIVHLTRKALRTPSGKDWWKRIRSDKRIQGPAILPPGTIADDEDEYGDFPIDEEEFGSVLRDIAAKRLLTPDDVYKGTMRRAEALEILRTEDMRTPGGEHREVWEIGRTAPDKLYGFASEWEIPVLLLVCRESYSVASKVYSRTFAAQGALAQTYFSYKLDTLFLDYKSVGTGFRFSLSSTNEGQLGMVLLDKSVREELARVERLTVEVPMRGGYRSSPRDGNMKEWLQTLAQVFPNLKKLTAVEVYHYEYNGHKQEYDYEDLRFLNIAVDDDGTSRVNGYRVSEEVKPQPQPPKLTFPQSLVDEAAREWEAKHADGRTFHLPKIEYKLLASRFAEKKLLEAAERVAKTEKKGCWYINPADPTDFEESASGELDEELESLLDWY